MSCVPLKPGSIAPNFAAQTDPSIPSMEWKIIDDSLLSSGLRLGSPISKELYAVIADDRAPLSDLYPHGDHHGVVSDLNTAFLYSGILLHSSRLFSLTDPYPSFLDDHTGSLQDIPTEKFDLDANGHGQIYGQGNKASGSEMADAATVAKGAANLVGNLSKDISNYVQHAMSVMVPYPTSQRCQSSPPRSAPGIVVGVKTTAKAATSEHSSIFVLSTSFPVHVREISVSCLKAASVPMNLILLIFYLTSPSISSPTIFYRLMGKKTYQPVKPVELLDSVTLPTSIDPRQTLRLEFGARVLRSEEDMKTVTRWWNRALVACQ
ncbi:hypothetical protein C8R42DRAFT_724652 [Lentinula raphanica]|nr:hypothetical protein C8R42DRAFT_724652 [Lentinula raphanica]